MMNNNIKVATQHIEETFMCIYPMVNDTIRLQGQDHMDPTGTDTTCGLRKT